MASSGRKDADPKQGDAVSGHSKPREAGEGGAAHPANRSDHDDEAHTPPKTKSGPEKAAERRERQQD